MGGGGGGGMGTGRVQGLDNAQICTKVNAEFLTSGSQSQVNRTLIVNIWYDSCRRGGTKMSMLFGHLVRSFKQAPCVLVALGSKP